MTATVNITSKFLNMDDLKLLSRHAGPCVTVSIPGFQPGAGAGSRHAHLRHLTQTAAEQLGHLNRPETGEMAAALELLAGTLDDGHGGPGVTLFCAPGFTASYETPGVRADAVTVGDRFHLLPLVSAALIASRFFVLGVSRNRIRLYHYADGRVEELALPAGVPPSLEAASAFDEPEHTFDSHSAAGPSVGGLRGVRFASTGDRDSDGGTSAAFLRAGGSRAQGNPQRRAAVPRGRARGVVALPQDREVSAHFRSRMPRQRGAFNARSSGEARSRRSDAGISSGRGARAESVA